MKLITKLFCIFFAFLATNVKAQMPNDGIYMPKKTFCIAIIGTESNWKKYWEGSLLRDNLNIGANTTQSVGVMAAVGITNKINLIVSLPYVSTSNSAGNLMGQKGIQDLSGWLKLKMLEKNGLSLNAIVGGSMPIGNYVPDFLPMSIGLQSKSATGRLLAKYQHKSGLYLQGHASYSYRSTINLDKDAYQANGKIYNSSTVNVPNTTDARAAFGYYKNGKQLEAFMEKFDCIEGDNIRRNDMPFPTNKMESTMYGIYGKYQPKNFGVNARAGYCFKGLNVGQSTIYSIGILYQFNGKNAIKN